MAPFLIQAVELCVRSFPLKIPLGTSTRYGSDNSLDSTDAGRVYILVVPSGSGDFEPCKVNFVALNNANQQVIRRGRSRYDN